MNSFDLAIAYIILPPLILIFLLGIMEFFRLRRARKYLTVNPKGSFGVSYPKKSPQGQPVVYKDEGKDKRNTY